ncbi:hypothetical protein [Pseudobacteriovorax antillogorgiicola]|uniref:Uncharacterized protein n=1 Tax=Pseudobacteriovorax antillogorgiicola TaxID=1513793 RepID=A0A1Y6BAN4_9BACT|nr:hypothetical protein [Pseudobacteriovorax antillogorgiicola]TCS57545.1 hypothetical protein EDD56_103285 [Pseudobacteriovorax antillogorgiicola]SME99867.1 hypothetical protein SAMN06296036_10348 [Pseudobacteriovorax antillogorgiicola]
MIQLFRTITAIILVLASQASVPTDSFEELFYLELTSYDSKTDVGPDHLEDDILGTNILAAPELCFRGLGIPEYSSPIVYSQSCRRLSIRAPPKS